MTSEHMSDIERAQQELQRAYLLLSWGHIDEALEACDEAKRLAPDHAMPPTVRGTVLIAAGRISEAMRDLRKACSRHPQEALVHLHFAEACLFAGRTTQGMRALAKARRLDVEAQYEELLDLMDETWAGIDDEIAVSPVVVAAAPESLEPHEG